MTPAVLDKPHQWVALLFFIAFGLLASAMAWRTWHGKPPVPTRTGHHDPYPVNAWGQFLVAGNIAIAGFSLALPALLIITHFNERTHALVLHVLLWPLEVLSFTIAAASGVLMLTLGLFAWPKVLIPPKWRVLPGDEQRGGG